ncbi:hypothetical protein [Pedobacter nutrimenti]|uniref:hypothetical protein n=1 Tax=Pedobacter nutrimenti TaxID=1241337 RepID=UPI00292CD790|nr:hypothetical protein [Pedobacter nutrimenti]
MRKTIFYIVAILIACLLIFKIWTKNQNNAKNSFTRNFTDMKIKMENVLDIPNPLFSFAGKTTENIILGNYSDHFNLFKVDYSLNRLDTLSIKFPANFNVNCHNIFNDFQSPNIYSGNTMGDISVSNKSGTVLYKVKGVLFDDLKGISNKTIVVRARNDYGLEQNLALMKLKLLKQVKIEKTFPLPKVVNGIFSNDGWLFYDQKYSRILYMYFYKGEFLSLDTNLNLAYKAKTIDTVNVAKIKVSIFSTKTADGKTVKKITPTTPPLVVNDFITTSDEYVYIISRLKADNEKQSDFAENQPIDVYSIKDGKYLYSFYIPKYKGNKLYQFKIVGNKILAIFEKNLITYNFKGIS